MDVPEILIVVGLAVLALELVFNWRHSHKLPHH